MLHLTIDEQAYQVASGWTILDACREYGIPVPTLCYHPALEPYGACRLCMVEISQPPRPRRLVASCVTPCEEGLAVWTNTAAVARSRRMTAELLLAADPRNPQLLSLASELGVTSIRFVLPETSACILCGLCVRACDEIVGVRAISLVHRGMEKKVTPPFEVVSPTCIGCGTCVLICPTGYLQLEDVSGYRSIHPSSTDFDRVECQVCSQHDLQPVCVEDISRLLSRKATYG
jgi:bidirectional [NiFe] hydrogenase diaphorase subunit